MNDTNSAGQDRSKDQAEKGDIVGWLRRRADQGVCAMPAKLAGEIADHIEALQNEVAELQCAQTLIDACGSPRDAEEATADPERPNLPEPHGQHFSHASTYSGPQMHAFYLEGYHAGMKAMTSKAAKAQGEMRAMHAAARYVGMCFTKHAHGMVRMQPLIAAKALAQQSEAGSTIPNAAAVSAYELPGSITVERLGQRDGSFLWAVRSGGNCLGKDGHWEHEPMPSSRTAQWLQAHRFDTALQAIDAALAQYKDQSCKA